MSSTQETATPTTATADASALRDLFHNALQEKFGADYGELTEYQGEITLQIEREALPEYGAFFKTHEALQFNVMSYTTCVDWLLHKRKPRFDVVYHLFSTKYYHRIRIKAGVPEEDCWSPSLYPVWRACNFMEREAYDMFGVEFRGHPDLRRILMPDDWEGHPLRKDFPLGGVKSFYFKRSTDPHAGEPPDLIDRIRVQESDV